MKTQLRHMWREIDDRLGNGAAPPLLSVSQTLGVVRRELISDKPPRADSFDKYKICEPGDLVLNRFNAYRGSLGISKERGIVSPDYLVIRAHRNSHPKFLDYLLRSEELSNFMKSTMGGLGASDPDVSGFSRIDVSSLGQYSLPTLEFQHQQEIVDFLDRETAQIDALIGKQEQLIELLVEKRQAIITHSVTKGLDRTAPTQPSGIPWVGDVPEHWLLPRLKDCCRIKRGRFMHRPRNAPHLYDGKYPFIQTGSIARAQGKYVTEYSQTLSEAGLATSAMMPKGTLVMAIAANIGDVAILSFDSCAPDSVVGFQPSGQANTDFLYYALIAKREELTSEAPVTSQGNLNVERVGNVTVPLPPLEEQVEIVRMLDVRLTQMSLIGSKASAMKRLLLERRSALISAAVTVKIDVRTEASQP